MDNATISQDIAELQEIDAANLSPDQKLAATIAWGFRNLERDGSQKPLREWTVADILAIVRMTAPPQT